MNTRHPMTGATLLVIAAGLCLVEVTGRARAQSPDHTTYQQPSSAVDQNDPLSQQSEHHMDHEGMGHAAQSPHSPGPVLPPITEADRAAAFPDVAGHAAHDDMIHYRLLFDQLEWQDADEGDLLALDATGWIGGDIDRLWLRSEGERLDETTEALDLEALWGHAFARWWDVVGGVRRDFEPGPSRTWAAVGVQGVAPYKFDIQATAYLGESARTALRFEAEYELLLTNRLILQPLLELAAFGKDDAQRGTGAGLSTTEFGLRLRYEFRREFAPYVGVTWNRKWGQTADFARSSGEAVEDTRLMAGLRIWF